MPGLKFIDAPTKRDLPVRSGTVKAVVIHTTGETDLDKALAWYQREDGLQPHYVIGWAGEIYQIVDEAQVAYHAGLQAWEAALYRMGFTTWSHWTWKNEIRTYLGDEFPGYRNWRDTWVARGIQSPLDLITGERPNSVSVGIELLEPVTPTKDKFTDAQYEALAALVDDIGGRHGLNLNREDLLQHSDISPIRRCNIHGPTDPGAGFNVLRLFDDLAVLAVPEHRASVV